MAERRAEPDAGKMDAEAHANMNDGEQLGGGTSGATEALEQKALALEERARSLASKNESLQARLDAALSEIESLKRSDEALQAESEAARCSMEAARVREAGLLEAERAAAADAHTLRASLAVASVETEAATVAATKARHLEVRRLEEKVARMLGDAQEKASEAERKLAAHAAQAATVTEERNAWAVRSTEWEAEARRLNGELKLSQERADGLEKELEAAVAMARDLMTSRREVERKLRAELETAQTAVLTLRSTSGETERYSEAALDDMRGSLVAAQARLGEMKRDKDAALRSLLEVAQMRTSPPCQLPSQPGVEAREHDSEQQHQDAEDESGDSATGGNGGGAGGCDRSGDARWTMYPGFVAVHRNGEEPRNGDSTQVPSDEGSKGLMEEADLDDSSSREGAPGETPPRTPGGTAVEPVAGRRRTNDGGAWGDVSWHSSSGAGEHVCRVCGAPAPSFRKLFDCRLSLDRARAEAAEARALAASNEEGAASETREAQSAFAAIRERLERRLAAESAAGSRLGESREASARHVERDEETRGREAAKRHGEIAALRTRLRLTQEEVGAARREAILEAQAKSLKEVEAARRKAARAIATAEALQDRCGQQEQTIASLAFSREKEVGSGRAAEGLLAKERAALVESEGRVQELELEVSSLTALLQAANSRAEKLSMALDKDACGVGGSNSSPSRNNGVDSSRFGGRDIPSKVRSGRHGMTDGRAQARTFPELTCESSRETNGRERARVVLEESLHAAQEEAEHLRRRIASLRAALREAQHRADQMEAAASSALAVADAERAAVATAKTDTAEAIRREAEQKRVTAERRQRDVVEALQAELSRATAVGFEAQEELAVARGELARLRKAVGEADRRADFLEENLALSTTSLHEAEAGRVRALVDRVLGRGWEGGEGRQEDEAAGCRSADASIGRVHCDTAVTRTGTLPLEGGTRRAGGGGGGGGLPGFSLGDETVTLRARLSASQAQHLELVRASEEAVASCSRRCEARIGMVVAAGKLAVACSRKRGIVAGRESAVAAACRVALLARCFRALREEALSRSRDRSIRRQERVHRWIREAFEQAGDVVAVRNHAQRLHQRRRVGAVAEEGAGGVALEGLFFSEMTAAK